MVNGPQPKSDYFTCVCFTAIGFIFTQSANIASADTAYVFEGPKVQYEAQAREKRSVSKIMEFP